VHEFSICRGIVEVARGAAARLPPPAPRIARVTVRIGRLTSVVPDSLRFYFGILTEGTPLEGAALAIEEVPIRGRCGDCAARFEIEELRFTCPACRSGAIELTSGRELRVVSLDTIEEDGARGN
jgi:hydrogenase nickel incorporation protein HypA/HybF